MQHCLPSCWRALDLYRTAQGYCCRLLSLLGCFLVASDHTESLTDCLRKLLLATVLQRSSYVGYCQSLWHCACVACYCCILR